MNLRNTILPVAACLFALAGLLWGGESAGKAGAAKVSSGAFTFRDASGTVQGQPWRMDALKDSIGWDRDDVNWQAFEPAKGEFNQEYLENIGKKVLEHKKRGVNFLPILAYGTPWAAETDATYILGNRKVVYGKGADGKPTATVFEKGADGEWKKEGIPVHHVLPFAEEFVPDWQEYVRKVVSFLMAPPYNVEYFQIWNEAHPESDFYDADLDTYMERVHLPAAKVIHELGGKVVYGGWPCCGTLSQYVALLDKHKAWESIDVLDVHYFPLVAFRYLRSQSLKRGFDQGIWQTEFGFASDKNFVANTYPRFVDWCLRNAPEKDKYKLFWFAQSAPDSPEAYGYGRTLLHEEGKLTAHGMSLNTLAGLLKGSSLELYEPVASQPALKPEYDERLSSLEAFRVDGKRIVVAVHLIPSNNAKIFTDSEGNSMHLDHGDPRVLLRFPALEKGRISKVERVSMTGSVTDLSPDLSVAPEGKGISLNVPFRDADLKDGKYTDMPENQVRQTFYVRIELKE